MSFRRFLTAAFPDELKSPANSPRPRTDADNPVFHPSFLEVILPIF
jgi:hypothetical protein